MAHDDKGKKDPKAKREKKKRNESIERLFIPKN